MTRVPFADCYPGVEVERSPLLERILFNPFIPKHFNARPELLQRIRMFLLSHLMGPLIGLVLAGYLIILQATVDFRVLTIIGSVIAFWIYLPALRLTGRFTLLALLSLQHLTFVILFASYHYGGIASPFFFWLLVVPLFGFFYLGDIPRLRLAIVAALILNVLLYFATYWVIGPAAQDMPLAGSDTINLLSVVGAGFYVMTMALSHARLLTKQTALLQQSETQRLISEQLLFAKEAAEAASRAKTEFLATTSHELRTPLNAIIGFSQLVRMQAHGHVDEKYIGYVRDIEESGKHLLEIINDILDIARAESGRFDLVEEDVDVRQVLAASLRLVHARAAKASLSISLRVPSQLPRLRADRRRVKQMLLNLLGNAIKFTPPGGSIVVAATVEDQGSFAVSVTDTGIGMAENHVEEVLQPFSQVDNSLARRHEGLGLGLSLVVNIMARHDGALQLTSSLGKGTVATIRFPSARVIFDFEPSPVT